MSVVCYDGELLAADRKSRVTGEDGTKRVKSLKRGKVATNFNKNIFDGEEIRAIGRAGRLGVSKEMIDCIRRSKDLAKTINHSLGDKIRKKFEGKGIKATSLLIMTTGHIHLVKITSKYEVTWRKEHRSKKLAIGSGAKIALFLMEQQGLSAVDAVAAMELHHDCCGGGVTYTSRIQSVRDEPILTLKFNGRRTLTKHFLKATKEAVSHRLASLPSY